ncbi:hypothetical protein ABPD29_09600 [Secundilactobacillus paracollinoides]|uniref:hypothetical protein n=1 Tax=Secundilactobacillus paracollinoides TaxID=240427 RepID=UPI003F454752
MHNIFNLIKKDFHNIFHRRAIWITLLAFALIPMFYAVLNIQVSWNPYSPKNTSRLEIAVVNSDEGGRLKDSRLTSVTGSLSSCVKITRFTG